jgi:glucokinase
MMEVVLAADLGGTNLRLAAVDAGGGVIARSKARTPVADGPDTIADLIVDLAAACRNELAGNVQVVAFGVAVPATLKAADGLIVQAPNLPMLDGFKLVQAVEGRTRLPVIIENDATAAAIGEHWLGASRSFDNSICITLGTGVGGGIILNGEPLRGPDGTAGEVGHICVEPNGYPCGCGSRGCLEQYASAAAVVRDASRIAEEMRLPESPLSSGLAAHDVYELALAGNRAALLAFESMGTYLGIVVAGLINVLNPEVVVLAGGLSSAWNVFIEHTRLQVRKRAFRSPAERARIVPARLGDDAGVLGAARLAFNAADQGILVG